MMFQPGINNGTRLVQIAALALPAFPEWIGLDAQCTGVLTGLAAQRIRESTR